MDFRKKMFFKIVFFTGSLLRFETIFVGRAWCVALFLGYRFGRYLVKKDKKKRLKIVQTFL